MSNLHETSNCRSKVAARTQINDPGDASLDNTAVQQLAFKHSCDPETIFSV